MKADTIDKAINLLRKYRTTTGYELYIGGLYSENDNDYAFVCWPFTDSVPVDQGFAFRYWINKESGEIVQSDAPIIGNKAIQLYERYAKHNKIV